MCARHASQIRARISSTQFAADKWNTGECVNCSLGCLPLSLSLDIVSCQVLPASLSLAPQVCVFLACLAQVTHSWNYKVMKTSCRERRWMEGGRLTVEREKHTHRRAGCVFSLFLLLPTDSLVSSVVRRGGDKQTSTHQASTQSHEISFTLFCFVFLVLLITLSVCLIEWDGERERERGHRGAQLTALALIIQTYKVRRYFETNLC